MLIRIIDMKLFVDLGLLKKPVILVHYQGTLVYQSECSELMFRNTGISAKKKKTDPEAKCELVLD